MKKFRITCTDCRPLQRDGKGRITGLSGSGKKPEIFYLNGDDVDTVRKKAIEIADSKGLKVRLFQLYQS